MQVSITGNDVIIINDKILSDGLADGDISYLTYPNDSATVKTGKNGNSIYALNESGRQADLVLRVIRGSSVDKFLNALFAQQSKSFNEFILMYGEIIKPIGFGDGNGVGDHYIISGGIFSKGIEVKTNTDGDTEQSVAIYNLKFSNAPRSLT